MNNGPRQALALNNPSLYFALCLTFSVYKSNHKLLPQNPHLCIHPISSVSSHCLQHPLFRSSMLLASPLTQILLLDISSLHQLFWFSFLVTLRQTVWIKAKERTKRPTFFWVLRTPFDPAIAPIITTWVTYSQSPSLTPTHLSTIEKALLDLYCLKGLGQNSEKRWTKQ